MSCLIRYSFSLSVCVRARVCVTVCVSVRLSLSHSLALILSVYQVTTEVVRINIDMSWGAPHTHTHTHTHKHTQTHMIIIASSFISSYKPDISLYTAGCEQWDSAGLFEVQVYPFRATFSCGTEAWMFYTIVYNIDMLHTETILYIDVCASHRCICCTQLLNLHRCASHRDIAHSRFTYTSYGAGMGCLSEPTPAWPWRLPQKTAL